MSISRILIFLVVVTGIVFGWHYYLWMRLVRDPSWQAPWGSVLRYAITGLGVAMPLSFLLMRALPRSLSSPIMWVTYIWMGLAFVMLFVALPLEVPRWLVARSADADPSRRLAIARGFAAVVGLVGGGLAVAGIASVLSKVAVERVRVSLAKLPKELAGYTIVQISDVHVGPTIGRAFIEQLVDTINREAPDMIVITGDLVDGSVAELGALVEPLKNLRAKDGVYFVTGNHEYYSGVDEWLPFLGTLGVRVLRNERVPIRGGAFELAGVDDHSAKGFGHGHGTDLGKALEGRDLTRALVLLAHQPKTILEAVTHGIDLQLSGHTHGGQIWPWGYAVKLDQPHVAGLSRHGDATIYVSRGTGYWGPPMRVGAPAEVTRIELQPA
jgi:uncharacterized protein